MNKLDLNTKRKSRATMEIFDLNQNNTVGFYILNNTALLLDDLRHVAGI